MPFSRRDFTSSVIAAALAPTFARAQSAGRDIVVIARGGAVGDAPAETRGAYDQAIRDGADFLQADLAITKDGVLIARRDRELSGSTDVAARTEFAARRTTKTVDGGTRAGWFAEDFTLAELKTLVSGPLGARRAKDQAPPSILTLRELIETARAGCVRTARTIGIYAGLPDPASFAGSTLPLEPRLAETIIRGGYNAAAAALLIESPDAGALKSLARLTRARRILRLGADASIDLTGARAVAHGVAPDFARILDLSNPRRPMATPFTARARAAGLTVHAWAAPGDPQSLMEAALAAGADGLCADLARPAARARGKFAAA